MGLEMQMMALSFRPATMKGGWMESQETLVQQKKVKKEMRNLGVTGVKRRQEKTRVSSTFSKHPEGPVPVIRKDWTRTPQGCSTLLRSSGYQNLQTVQQGVSKGGWQEEGWRDACWVSECQGCGRGGTRLQQRLSLKTLLCPSYSTRS